MPALQAIDVHKSYGPLSVLKGVDLTVKSSEIIAIMGSSGAGKSTLLHILGTLDRADAGQLFIDGKDILLLQGMELARFRNEHMGFVFQFHNLLPEFTALENVCIPMMIKGMRKDDAAKEGAKLLSRLGLEARFHHKPSELSGGEQQRVAVARALSNKPSIVFADEPSGNLDEKNSLDLHEWFQEIRDSMGQAFLIVTHSLELAKKADRILVLRNGKLYDA